MKCCTKLQREYGGSLVGVWPHRVSTPKGTILWILFALGAAILTSFNPILCKRMLRDMDTFTLVYRVTLLSLPFLGLFTCALSQKLPRLDWVFAVGVVGSGVLNVVSQLASTRALKLADVSNEGHGAYRRLLAKSQR